MTLDNTGMNMPKIFEVTLLVEHLGLPDADLGALVRAKAVAALAGREEAKMRGAASIREKLGTKITIDGVEYPSRAAAQKALGLSFKKFVKLYGYRGQT